MIGMKGDQFFFVPYRQGKSRVIVNTPFNNRIEIGKDFVNFVRNLCDDPDLLRISNAGKDACDFAGVE
jgi:hypothetical protein